MDLNGPLIKRISILLVFLVADIWLGIKWIRMQREEVLVPVTNFLLQINPNLPQVVLGETLSKTVPEAVVPAVVITADAVADSINTARTERKLHELEVLPLLSQGAQEVVTAIVANNLSFEGINTAQILTTFFQKKKVDNLSLYHDALIGPRTMVQLEEYWNSDFEHGATIAAPELVSLGVATGSAWSGDQEQGVVVLIYAKPQAKVQQAAVPKVTQEKITFPEISDSSILEALNVYRATHKVHGLLEHPKLCEYAEKRVQDLVAYGGLDNHEGFKRDFADQNNLPQAIRDYPGGAIGENLAYQNCRNMQTGQGFMAETATALIEWCFDSSTKGHREAQLNSRYNNVCARHAQGYFVIIFGE
jgi:uncharacterized protein YkwD